MKRIRFLLAVLTIATILSGCSGGEKSKPEPVAKLLKEFETKDHLDGTALARWMDCVAQATITANPEGYAIDIDKGLLGFQTIWCFQQDGFTMFKIYRTGRNNQLARQSHWRVPTGKHKRISIFLWM